MLSGMEAEANMGRSHGPVQRGLMRLVVRLHSASRFEVILAAMVLGATALMASILVMDYLMSFHLPPSYGVLSLPSLALSTNPRVPVSPGVTLFGIREFSRTCCEVGPTVYRRPTIRERNTQYFAGERSQYSYKLALQHFLQTEKQLARVFVPIAQLDEFIGDFFLRLPGNARIVLITGQEDCGPSEVFGYSRNKCKLDMPMSLYEFVSDPRLAHWFAQNYDFGDVSNVAAYPQSAPRPNLPPNLLRKLSPLPIGVDFHTSAEKVYFSRESPKSQEAHLISLANPKWSEKKQQILSVFTVAKERPDRLRLLEVQAGKEACVYSPGHVDKIKLWSMHQDQAFVFCPQGNGIDTHRIYEALILGSVPVTISSPLDALYKQLPIIILDSWEDFDSCGRTEEWRQEIIARFGSEPFEHPEVRRLLTLDYWVSVTFRKLVDANDAR
mmetsp:Transcript_3902/g.8349  ORF Transcript_3902/g.8349 Transcript_3902/m.8349 type:complete len:441 (-) Transcript_3902:366-1688(-)|eukprot:CAMPEP_0171485886 /NCGR_PEP_ID=MMETSP0958-20121227/788_1 /TAXON_ID=87120 /ORGANISM="Aurantiochytrium limacinum, Strain ATCCMYA-1381" /LENGTH=440 /DNA_ID=CAMNT_0012018713 /DNA_START=588 /DNA_END=1910 /DNA_ORIENTATION=-